MSPAELFRIERAKRPQLLFAVCPTRKELRDPTAHRMVKGVGRGNHQERTPEQKAELAMATKRHYQRLPGENQARFDRCIARRPAARGESLRHRQG